MNDATQTSTYRPGERGRNNLTMTVARGVQGSDLLDYSQTHGGFEQSAHTTGENFYKPS